MPTYCDVNISDIERDNSKPTREGKKVGEFKIKIRPKNIFRRAFTRWGHEITQYLRGRKGKFRITIEREGKGIQPFYFNIEQVKPDSKQIFFESNIIGNKYEGDFGISFSGIGEYIYSIEIYSQLAWPESKREIMYVKVLSFDTVVVYLLAVLFSGSIGSLLTWLFMK